MSVLLLRLAAPMQAWGVESRFNYRGTRREPSRSGVVGLLASAHGRRRTEDVSDLARLKFGVRIDQPGQVETDFHTTIDQRAGKAKPLTTREYLMDAVFTVGLEGDRAELERHREALLNPVFPLFLGRRSCPPSGPIVLDIVDTGLTEALEEAAWQASRWYRRKQGPTVILPILRDADLSEEADEIITDMPVSFDPTDRVHQRRAAVLRSVQKENSDSRWKRIEAAVEQDPLSVLEDL